MSWNAFGARGALGAIVLAGGLAALAAAGCKEKAATSGGSATGDKAAPTRDFVIGAYLSMTGSMADFGISTERGALLAIDEINAAGGIKGRKLALKTLDDQGKADEAGNAVTRLIDVDKADAILGEVASSLSLVGGRIAQRRGIPMVSPSSTNSQVTEIGDYVFRACFLDPFQGWVMARFAREKLKAMKAAVLKDVRNDYSIGLADAFVKSFTISGGRIVIEQSYGQGDTDFSAQLTAIKAQNPDVLFLPGYYAEVGNIAKQARRLGLTAPLLGGDGWESPQLYEIGGADIVGSYFSTHFAADAPGDRAQRFIAAYKKKHGEEPTGMAALGYDAVLVIADAAKRATDASPKALRDALAKTKDIDAATGKITLDAKRNPVKPAVVVKVVGKKAVFDSLVSPPY
jgi:branched-chain amino acid transport system substrate-binding protein